MSLRTATLNLNASESIDSAEIRKIEILNLIEIYSMNTVHRGPTGTGERTSEFFDEQVMNASFVCSHADTTLSQSAPPAIVYSTVQNSTA